MKKTITSTLLATALLMTSGCGNFVDKPPSNGGDMDDKSNEFDRLKNLPDSKEAKTSYEQLGDQIRQELSKTVPELQEWREDGKSIDAGCLDGDGEKLHLPAYISNVALTGEQYEKALGVIGNIAKKNGFPGTPRKIKNTPQSRYSSFARPDDNSQIVFGTIKNTMLQLNVGCRLTPEAKKRGTPSES